jgi:hypothetical protein
LYNNIRCNAGALEVGGNLRLGVQPVAVNPMPPRTCSATELFALKRVGYRQLRVPLTG